MQPAPLPTASMPPSPMSTAAEAYRRIAAKPRPTLGLFTRIADAWKLDRAQRMALMGIEGESRYHRWMRDPTSARMTVIQAERLSQVSAIAEHLYAIHAGAKELAESWPTRPNDDDLYGGQAPIDVMCSGPTETLIEVRRRLGVERHR